MATASRSLATAQWRARFASGLLHDELHLEPGHDLGSSAPFLHAATNCFSAFAYGARSFFRRHTPIAC
jgi:hypothetical protein